MDNIFGLFKCLGQRNPQLVRGAQSRFAFLLCRQSREMDSFKRGGGIQKEWGE
jgi:hypothetical protein